MVQQNKAGNALLSQTNEVARKYCFHSCVSVCLFTGNPCAGPWSPVCIALAIPSPNLSALCTGSVPPILTLSKVQKILRNATRSENTFQSFNIEVYEKFFFQLSF